MKEDLLQSPITSPRTGNPEMAREIDGWIKVTDPGRAREGKGDREDEEMRSVLLGFAGTDRQTTWINRRDCLSSAVEYVKGLLVVVVVVEVVVLMMKCRTALSSYSNEVIHFFVLLY